MIVDGEELNFSGIEKHCVLLSKFMSLIIAVDISTLNASFNKTQIWAFINESLSFLPEGTFSYYSWMMVHKKSHSNTAKCGSSEYLTTDNVNYTSAKK